MEARDFRSLGRPAQEALRRRALYLVAEEGMSQAQAAQAVGVHRQTVNIWLRRYRERGEEGVLDGRRVSPRRGKGLLADDEAGQAQAWITGSTPPTSRGCLGAFGPAGRCASWSSAASASGSACRPCSSTCGGGA